jgi:hypothetical protein
MEKPVKHGIEEINGERVSWTYYYNETTKRGRIKARYDGHWLIEEDNGNGFETALTCLRLVVIARQKNKEDMDKKQPK